MSLGKRLINTGGVSEAACLTEDVNPFTGTSADGGVALYSLDYDASDESGDYDGTPTDVTFGVGGQINYGARFNGSSSKITAPSILSSSYTGSVSFSAWFNMSNSSSNIHAIIASDDTTPVSGKTILVSVSNGVLELTGYNFATFVGTGTTNVADGEWHNIIVVLDNSAGTFNLYLDGNSTAEITHTNSLGSNLTLDKVFSEDWTIGSQGTIRFFDGDIDQVRIFSKALSTDNNGVNEIATLYAETACVHTATTTDNYFPLADGSSDAVAYYKLDNSAEDEKGNYDGTTTNVSYEFGRYGQAAHFSSGTFITSSFASLSQVTVSFWVKMTDVDTTRAWFVARYGTNREFAIYTYDNSFNASLYYNGNNGNAIIITTSDYFNDNTWHHIAYTANGSTSPKLYIDGVERGTAQYSDATRCAYYTSSEPLSMGYSRTSSAYNSWDGRLDQVRIFSTELDSDQVSQLYNEKPETDTSNFKTVLYEGNDATSHFISNVGYDLDAENGGDGGLVWVKNRTGANSHILVDSIRGANNLLFSDATSAALTSNTTLLSSLEKTGFFVGYDGTDVTNGDANSYVAWVWKGGGDAVAGSGSGVTNVSKSVNADAGFSIVEYTGGGSASNTVEHGFDNQTPELIIVKCISDAAFWCVWSSKLTSNYNLALNLTNAQFAANSGSNGGLGDATSSDITFVSGSVNLNTVNGSGRDYIAYCFHSVSGYSKIGTYEGLGTSTVTVSDVGFKPSFIMIKNIDATANWNMYDVRRSTVADRANKILYPNLSNSEPSATNYYFDMNDSGFVVSATNHEQHNFAGRTYLYMAFK